MTSQIDLSVEVAGVRFPNPVLPAASELVFDGASARQAAETGVGGLVTKTFTTDPAFRIRPRPYQFPLGRFGSAFRQSGSFFSLAAPHVADMETILSKNVPAIREVGREYNLPVIVSFYERPEDLQAWMRIAQGMQRAGADMIEINFSSPTMAGALERSLAISMHITEAVASSVQIPWGVKISPFMEPLVEAVSGWVERGAAFVTAHNSPGGIFVDVENEVPYGAPVSGGYPMGRTFLPLSLGRVVRILKNTEATVLGAGGIFTAPDALQYLLCGCHLVETATAVYMKGLGVFREILSGVTTWMTSKGYRNLADFRGKLLPKIRANDAFRQEQRWPFVMPPEAPYAPSVDQEKCSGCGACARACFYKALVLVGKKGPMQVFPERCWSCGLCVGLCSEGAVTLVERATGRMIWDGYGMAKPFFSA
jgi:dihydropyrimidine dehydrogenase (NAD+) subunit PreA